MICEVKGMELYCNVLTSRELEGNFITKQFEETRGQHKQRSRPKGNKWTSMMITITQAYSGIGRLQIAVTTDGLEWEPYVEIICITHGFVRYWVLNINRNSVGTWVKWNTVMHLQCWRSPAWTSLQRLCWDAKEQIGVCALIYIEPLATRICRQNFGIAAAFHQWEFESHQLLSILESPAMPTMAAILLFSAEDRAPLITYT